MDDMIGAMLDIDDGVQEIIDWIANNGGYVENALYVTADHDHYLTLLENFPETLANFLIDGESHNITPQNNSNKNPWSEGIKARSSKRYFEDHD
jgi:alkaline phosphatase